MATEPSGILSILVPYFSFRVECVTKISSGVWPNFLTGVGSSFHRPGRLPPPTTPSMLLPTKPGIISARPMQTALK